MFADPFDQVAAWPVGQLGPAAADVRDGRFYIAVATTDVPVVIRAAWPGETIRPAARVQVRVDLAAAGATRAGVVGGSADGSADIVFLAEADGHWRIALNTTDGYADLAAGTTTALAAARPHTLTLQVGATNATGWIDGTEVGHVDVGMPVSSFGLAVWATAPATVVSFDDYGVWAARP